MGMTRNYYEIVDDLTKGILTPALAARARAAVNELLTSNECMQSEIVRLRRQIEALEMKEEEKLADLREGNRAPYRGGKYDY